MAETFRLALAQINVTVGDFAGNQKKILDGIEQAKKHRADLIAFPEMTITGYPPEDLLLRDQFINDSLNTLQQIVSSVSDIIVILGSVNPVGDKLLNSATVIYDNKIWGHYYKIQLPNYGVFDEKRYFQEGSHPVVLRFNDMNIGISVCEDLWIPDSVIETEALIGNADVVVNISASPYCAGKIQEREDLVVDRAVTNRVVMGYVNLIGGQDELVFDGSSLIVNERGHVVARGEQFRDDVIFYDIDVAEIRKIRDQDDKFIKRKQNFPQKYQINIIDMSDVKVNHRKQPTFPEKNSRKLDSLTEVYRALVLGTRDYVRKNGFKKVVLGLSGGIDSALSAVIAVDALGKENVVSVAMPSQFSSEESLEDARLLAQNLGIELKLIPIQDTYLQYQKMLKDEFSDLPFDTTEENIQARIRGNIIMALSNKFGWLALTTGNKSEISVGYCTLYGDMVGGFAVIKDVPKTLVFQLSEHINKMYGKEIIPQRIIDKPPSAELRPNQKDEDSLPPYHILDPILAEYVEKNTSFQEIVKKGFDEETVRRVIKLVDSSEYKRRQAPPGVKITPRAFGKDRRMPITSRYKG